MAYDARMNLVLSTIGQDVGNLRAAILALGAGVPSSGGGTGTGSPTATVVQLGELGGSKQLPAVSGRSMMVGTLTQDCLIALPPLAVGVEFVLHLKQKAPGNFDAEFSGTPYMYGSFTPLPAVSSYSAIQFQCDGNLWFGFPL